MPRKQLLPLIRKALVLSGVLALSIALAGCPGPSNPADNHKPTTGTDTPITPAKLSQVSFIATAPLATVAPLQQAAGLQQAAAFRIQADNQFETPLKGAKVIAKPVSGGDPVVGKTDDNGKVTLDLSPDKIYRIAVEYEIAAYDAEGKLFKKPAQLEALVQPPKADTVTSTANKINMATTLVTKTIPQDLSQIDPEQVKAVDAAAAKIDAVFQNDGDKLSATLLSMDLTTTEALSGVLRDIAIVSHDATVAEAINAVSPAASGKTLVSTQLPGIDNFVVARTEITLYRFFPNGKMDAKYPAQVPVTATTTFTDQSSSSLAIWTLPESLTLTSGYLTVSGSSPSGDLDVTATVASGAAPDRQQTITVHIRNTPMEVRSVTLGGPTDLSLYVPASGEPSNEETPLNLPSTQQLSIAVKMNDDTTTKKVAWTCSPEGAATVDANGLLSVSPSAPAGPVTVTATALDDPSQKATYTFTVKRSTRVDVEL